jgi:T5SS/PEP-CTERM-associated repeat protein
VARTFVWLRAASGNFDGPGNWGIYASGTLTLVPDVPTPADIAVFDGMLVTVGSIGSFGTAGVVDVTNSSVTLIGGIQFGAFAIDASTFAVAADGTLSYVAGYQLAPQTALDVSGSNAVLSVAGAGALVTVQDPATGAAYLQVGATDTLSIAAGGMVLADVLDLAGTASGSADAVIDAGGGTAGAGPPMLSASWLAVGDGGPASLAIRNGALAEAGIVTVGFGEALGPGSGTLAVGSASQLVATGYAAFGYAAGDRGSGTIDGSGSGFASAGLFVGNQGAGTLTIQNDATLTTAVEAGDTTGFAGAIANLAGATGTLTVTGVGSTWALAGRIDIGAGGSGTLDVLGGGAVRADVADVPIVTGGTTVYDATVSLVQATVAVLGAGSTLDAGGGPIYVGDAGTASLSVGQGGAVIAAEPAVDYAAMVVGLNGGAGTLSLSDAGSTLDALGQLDVGGAGGGSGTLQVFADATLWSGGQPGDPVAGLSLGDGTGSSGIATIDGAGSVLSNTGRLDVGRYGSGVLSIGNGGTLTTRISAGAEAVQPASVLLGVNPGASGTVYVSGANSVLNAASDMIVGLAGTGTLQLLDGGAVGIGTNLAIGNPLGSGAAGTGQGVVTVGAGDLTVGGSLAIGSGGGGGDTGTGTLAVAAGAVVQVAGSATLAAGSTISVDGGGLEIGGTGGPGVDGIVVDAGATLAGAGSVQGPVLVNGVVAAAGGVLALASASGPGTLTIAAGATLDVGAASGGGTVDFVGGGTLRLHTAASGTALLVGLDGGTLDMAGMAVGSAAYGDGTLTVYLAGSQMTMALAAPPPPGEIAVVSDGAGGTDVVLPCFAAGTRLAAPQGWVAVEDVRPGDRLLTASGRVARAVWVGGRMLDCRRHARPLEVQPVRVRAGALAPGVPARDVRLSPDHALLVQGSLIPVRYLLNGASIVQEAASRITYRHVELADHDVLLAEGLPCESFLDTGNRHAFAAEGPTMLHPEFGPEALARAIWAEKGCAPLVLEGPALERARRLFLRRATALGHRRTRNPALRVLPGALTGARALPAEVAGPRWQVSLPDGLAEVRLVSRIWVPAHMRPHETDTRVLGVAIARLTLDGREAALDSPALAQGWHPAEPDWRWTDGAGVLPVGGARVLGFELAMVGDYWARPANAAARASDGG